jgi:hypothetical protein
LPNYAFSLGWDHRGPQPDALPIIAVRRGVPDYTGPALSWPPGWARLWSSGRVPRGGQPELLIKTNRADAPFDAAR